MKNWINGLLVAGQFLTIMPPVIKRLFTPAELGRAVGFFPLIGLLLGLILCGADYLLSFFLPAVIRPVFLLTLWIVLTGVLHLDGFLDACDGLFGGFTAEKRLEIMRDERVGAYALAGGGLLLLLLYTSLRAIDTDSFLSPALLLAPVIGRWAISMAVVAYPYARTKGLGRTMKDEAGPVDAALATFITVLLTLFIGQLAGLLALLLVLMLVVAGARFVMRRIPGLTGDIYGSFCVLAEALVLLAFIAVATVEMGL